MDSIESYKLITPPNRIQGPKKLCYESQDNVRLSCLNLLFFHTVWNFQIHPRFVKTDLPMDYPQLMMLETPWFWVNYNNSLNWIKAILGWFLLLTMIIVRSQWGRYNLPRYIIKNFSFRSFPGALWGSGSACTKSSSQDVPGQLVPCSPRTCQ